MSEEEKPKVAVTILRMGYGHIRAGLAIADTLYSCGVNCRLVTLSDLANPFLKTFLNLLDFITGIAYRNFPSLSIKFTQKKALPIMNLANRIGRLLDQNNVNLRLDKNFEVQVATHSLPATLINLKTIFLVLDPYAPGYSSLNPEVIYAVPDVSTAEAVEKIGKEAGEKRIIVVTGPFIAQPVSSARKNLSSRVKELANGAGLKITIATGGSISHQKQIINLTDAYLRSMIKGARIGEINIIVGNSENLKNEIEKLKNPADSFLKDRINIIYNTDQIFLVHEADHVISQSDVIHAKTGELVYTAAGGKVFETLHPPSLGIQEFALRKYVEEKTAITFEGIKTSSLQAGEIDSAKEVGKILSQLDNGLLCKRMEAGLKIPSEGAYHISSMILDLLNKKSSEIFQPGIHNLLS